MLSFFADNAVLLLIISGVTTGVFIYLIEHFKKYVLDGSRDPLKITSLRYLQIFVGFLTVALLGLILSLFGLVGFFSSIQGNQNFSQGESTPTDIMNGTPQSESNEGVSPTLATTSMPTVPPPPPSSTPAVVAIIGNTGGAGANLRTIPGMEGTIITSVNEGTEVTVLADTETKDGFTWQLIILPDGRQGWVVSSYLVFQ
jgi:hypothetical protein